MEDNSSHGEYYRVGDAVTITDNDGVKAIIKCVSGTQSSSHYYQVEKDGSLTPLELEEKK